MSDNSDKEIWKNIPSIIGYQVSNKGRVKARFRAIVHKRRLQTRSPKLITPCEDKGGYKFVRMSRYGKIKRVYIHVLVAEAFHGPNPDTEVYSVDHIDRNRHNNTPENLRYATKEEQTANRVLNPAKGEDVGTSKLKEEQIKEIKRLKREKNLSNKKLGLLFNVAHSTIGRICRGEIWKEIE